MSACAPYRDTIMHNDPRAPYILHSHFVLDKYSAKKMLAFQPVQTCRIRQVFDPACCQKYPLCKQALNQNMDMDIVYRCVIHYQRSALYHYNYTTVCCMLGCYYLYFYYAFSCRKNPLSLWNERSAQ